jgi:hypothetical protein
MLRGRAGGQVGGEVVVCAFRYGGVRLSEFVVALLDRVVCCVLWADVVEAGPVRMGELPQGPGGMQAHDEGDVLAVHQPQEEPAGLLLPRTLEGVPPQRVAKTTRRAGPQRKLRA